MPDTYIVQVPVSDTVEALQPAARLWSVTYLVCLTLSVSVCDSNIFGILAPWATSQVYLNYNIWTRIIHPSKLNGFHENICWNIIWFVSILWWDAMSKLGLKEERYMLNVHRPYLLAMWHSDITLEWRHNGRDGVSNHQPYHCLLNSLSRRRSKKTSCHASLAFVWGIHRWLVNSPHKRPVTRNMFPFDDIASWVNTC